MGEGEPVVSQQVKPILDVLDDVPLFPKAMIPFFQWISSYYIYPVGEVIKSALPGGINQSEFVTVEILEKGICFLMVFA